MKQKISLLLAFLAVWTMTACGNTEPRETAKTPAADTSAVTDTETEAETEPSIVELLGEKDMNGATYTMLDGSNGIQINIPGEELTGEAVNDAMIHRDNFLEEEYNVVIDYIGMKTGEALSAMQKSVKAGDDAFNLVVATIFDFANQVNGHYLYNMMELPYVEAAQPWYSPLMADSLSLDGHMYFTASDICPSVYQSSCCMFLNLKLYDDFGIDTDIYASVIDGKWTLDQLISLQKDLDRDLDGDNKWKAAQDFFGVGLQPTSETATAFLAGANASFCVKDGTTLSMDGVNERTIGIMEKLASFCLNIQYSDINDVINICFKEDKALFLQHKLESAAVHLRDMENSYLVLPSPKADEEQAHYQSMVSGYCTSFIAIPATAEPELTGFITEAMARYSHERMRSLAFDMVYKDKISRDPRTSDVLDILLDNLYIDFGIVYNFGSLNDLAANSIFKGAAFMSGFEKKAGAIEKGIAKTTKAWTE